MQQRPRCNGRTKSGAACTSFAGGDGYCVAHSPSRIEQLAEWRQRGGKAKATSVRAKKRLGLAMGTEELQRTLSQILRDLLAGDCEAPIASAAATVAKALVSITDSVEVERRLEELEARAGLGGSQRLTG